MSRIGKLPVNIPNGVEVNVKEGNLVEVKGPKGSLSRNLSNEMIITIEEGTVLVKRPSDAINHRALHGLTRTLIDNMVVGVSEGFQKTLKMVGVGYRASMQGKKLVLAAGYSHPVEMEAYENTELEVPAQDTIIVRGIDKEKVGSLAANIRAVREPEPYKGKGIRYSNEVVKLRPGKTAGK